MFKCAPCNYETNDGSNFGRHVKSNRHLLNEKKHNEFQIFTKQYGLNNHVGNIVNITDYEKLKEENSKLKEEINMLKDDKKMLKEDKVKLWDLAAENSKTANKSLRGINYAMKHLKNAKQLKLLEGDEAVKLLTYDNTKSKNDAAEAIIIKFKNNLLDQYLGEILIKAYKKNDSTLQSVWGVDATRMHFILKQKKWTSDNCGVKLTELVIDPFLKSVEKMIKNYCEKNKKKSEKKDNNKDSDEEYDEKQAKTEFDKFTKKWAICQEILIELSKRKIHKQILKYISPHLKLTLSNIDNKCDSDSDDDKSESSSSSSDKKPKKIKSCKHKSIKKKIIVSDSDSDSD